MGTLRASLTSPSSRPGQPLLNITQSQRKLNPGLWPTWRLESGCAAGATTHPGSSEQHQPGPPPARLLRNAAPSSPARASPGASTLATAPFVALPPGQVMVWPSASSQFPHSSASSALRTRRRSTQRPSPTAQPGLVYSLTLHPETQEPAARTPARCGHAPAPRPRPAHSPPPWRVRIQRVGHLGSLLRRCVFG